MPSAAVISATGIVQGKQQAKVSIKKLRKSLKSKLAKKIKEDKNLFKVKFPRSTPSFPHRNPSVFKLAVTVKSHLLASAVCANFPKFVSNSSIIAGCRNGLRSKP